MAQRRCSTIGISYLEQELRNMPNLYKYVQEVTNKMAWIEETAAVVGDTKPWFIHPAGMMGLVVDPIADDMDERWLIVSQGQLTFNAEGNDIESSQFFSRVIHWPGNSLSGVTIGRGYDLGDRSQEEVYNDLQNAEVPHDIAIVISNGARLKGEDASSYVSENRARTLISRKSQFKLFESIYPLYVSRAKSNYERWTTEHEITSVNIPDISTADKTQWSTLDAKVKDVIVDLVYQGFTKGPKPMIYGMLNDREKYAEYIVGNPSLRQYEPGRKRAEYLRGN